MTLVPERIRWYDDMLVTARHVEALSARLEGLVQALPARYHPFPWGVLHDDVVLDDRVVAVRALDAVMPNGAPVFVDREQPMELDLRPFLAQGGQRRFLVHLATPIEEREAVPVPRFVLDGTGGIVGDDAVPAERKRRQLVLIAGEVPPRSHYASFPLVEVSTDRPAPALTEFVPPLLQVAPPRPLAGRCAALTERLRREVAALVRRVPDDGQPPFSTEVRAQVSPVIAALPPFEVLLASHPHPYALYLELCRVGAAVAVLRNRVAPPSFPAYEHSDIRATFEPLLRFLLGQGTLWAGGTSGVFPFGREGPWFRLPPDQGWVDALARDSPLDLILAVQAVASESTAAQWAAHCVIASRSVMAAQLARRVHGAGRRRVAPTGALPADDDVFLFRLDPDPELMKPGEDLLVLGDHPGITPATLTLYVINREGTDSDAPRP